MLHAVRVIARQWHERGTTQYPPAFVQSLSHLFREAYFVEHGEYPPDPPPTPEDAAASDQAAH
jgi:hypothetical protein